MITVCHFTSVHARYDPRIFYKQCSSLATKYKTILIVADGLGSEIKNQVQIIDVGAKKKGKLSRILITTFNVFKTARSIKADIYEFHDPELLFFGWLLKSKSNRVIFDMHEDTAGQILIRDWIPTFLKSVAIFLYSFIEKLILKRLDSIFVPQEFMREKFKSVNKTVTIHNYLLTSFFPDILPKSKVDGLLYVGSISYPRGIMNMLNMLEHVDTTLTLVGRFDDSNIEQKARSHPAWKKVKYIGVLPFEEVKNIYKGNYIALVPFKNLGQYKHSHVIKVFEYMAFGLPIIMPNFGDWPAFNQQYKVGLETDTENSEKFAKTVTSMLHKDVSLYSKNGRTHVKNEFLWDSVEKILLKSYDSLEQA